MSYEPPATLIFRENKPRTSRFHPVYLYVIHNGYVHTEDGEAVPLDTFLDERFPDIERGFCLCRNAGVTVKRVVDHMDTLPAFNARFRLARRTRSSHRDPERTITSEYLMAAFFGLYRDPEQRRRGYVARHIVLDPDTFLRLPKHARPYVPNTPEALLAFGRTLVAWCEANDMPVVSSGIQIATALLRDKRFMPEPLRKVPAATNQKARNALTGHLFYTQPKLRSFPHLFCLDQVASHHRCALELSFPHPDRLYARGYYRTLRRMKWTDPAHLRGHHGLIYARCKVTTMSPFFAQLDRLGSRLLWITTNELPYLEAQGLRVEHIVAAWTAEETDRTLNRYAGFAIAELARTPEESKWWKKPLLLAPYGLLGVKRTRPTMQADTKPRPKATPRTWHVGSGETITVYPLPSPERPEPNFCNVIARAMIERESQARTAVQAIALQRTGWEVVMVDADAVLVAPKRNAELPAYDPAYWKLTRLDDVAMQGPNLVSAQVVKLPGIPGTFRERYVTRIRKLAEPTQERMDV